mgnify:CR=1 FL=1
MLKEFRDFLYESADLSSFVLFNDVLSVDENKIVGLYEEEIKSGKKIIIPGLYRCLGIGMIGEIQSDSISAIAGIHMTPFTDMKGAYELIKSEAIDVFVSNFGLSMLIFAGGKIGREEDKILYEKHHEYVVDPLVKEFRDVTCVRFVPDSETFKTDLLLEKDYAKVVQMTSSFIERVGVVRYDYK